MITIPISTAILTGGKSTRMGTSKAFVTYNNATFIDTIITQLQPYAQPIISVADAVGYKNYANTLPDEIQGIGPLGGIYTCLKHATHDNLFVCAVDMPFIKKELIAFMATYINSHNDAYIITTGDRAHPLCAIYNKSMLATIEAMAQENNYRLTDLLNKVSTKYIPLEHTVFNESVVANINTKEELQAIQKPYVFCVSGLKNTGKTTLITKLIKSLKEKGYTIGVIKHDGHDFEIDLENTDTYKYKQAGASAQIIYSQTKYAVIKQQKDTDVNELINYINHVDIIIIEGLKNSHINKIELVKDAPVCDEKYVKAYVTDTTFTHGTIPTFTRNDIDKILEVICSPILTKTVTV